MIRIGPIAAALMAASAFIVGDAGVADAHAVLESTSPAPGAVLSRAPREVVLHFGEPVEIPLGSIRLFDSSGNRVDEGTTFHLDGDTHSVAVDSSSLRKGTFVVAWRVISADTHPVEGAFVFSVGIPSVSRTKVTSPSDAELLARRLASQGGSSLVGGVYWFVRMAVYAAMFLLVGTMAILWAIWKEGWSRKGARVLVWTAWVTLLAGTIVTVALQGVYASQLPITNILSASLFDSVLHTRLGELSIVRVGLLLLAAFLLSSLREWQGDGTWRARFPRWCALIGTTTAAGLLLTTVLTGHAASGRWIGLGIVTDFVHLSAISVWLGGLVLVSIVLFGPAPSSTRDRSQLTELIGRFSRLALWAVALVVAAGVVQAIRQVGDLEALWSTTYGRLLVAKVCLVCLVLAAASLSRRAVHARLAVPAPSHRPSTALRAPRPARPGAAVASSDRAELHDAVSWRRLRRSVLVELVIVAAVLGVTSGLVNAEPAEAVEAQPYAQTLTIEGVQTTILVEPAKAGPTNQFHIFTLHPDGLPDNVPEVDVSLDLPADDIGPLDVPIQSAGFAHFIAVGVDIPISGDWKMTVRVRKGPVDEAQVTTTLPVH